jgi:hypothetical protein
MPLLFNTLLNQAHVPPTEVRLLRHQDHRSERGKGPYELWRDDRPAFRLYQETQSFQNRTRLKAAYWASFVVTPVGETLLAGFYRSRYLGINNEERPWPNNASRTDPVGTCDIYELNPDDCLDDLAGRLVIEWGDGERSWIQRADNQNKVVSEMRTVFREPDFPGFADFIAPLSKIEVLPRDWITALQSSRGVYLLTCPKTKEQYVGKATGDHGFYGRWLDYVRDGYGGNVGLKSRDPSDYQVSILQVAGDAEAFEIDAMETRWKQKLQSREMGLNRN